MLFLIRSHPRFSWLSNANTYVLWPIGERPTMLVFEKKRANSLGGAQQPFFVSQRRKSGSQSYVENWPTCAKACTPSSTRCSIANTCHHARKQCWNSCKTQEPGFMK